MATEELDKFRTLTVGHVIPLIGAYMMAIDRKLNIHKRASFESSYVFSYDAFAKNEAHIYETENKKVFQSSWVPKFVVDAKKYSIDEYKELIKKNKIPATDIICGIPPCAGLSMLNNQNDCSSTKSRGADADQNMWMFELIKFYLASCSKVLVFENAPGLVGKHGVKVIEQMYELLKNNGYSNHKVHLVKTTTLNHGLPQHRQRSFCYIYEGNNFVKLKNKNNTYIKYEDFFDNYTEEEDEATQHFVLRPKLTREYEEFLFKNKKLIKDVRELYKNVDNKCVSLFPYFLEVYAKDKSFIDKDKFPTIHRTAEHALKKLASGKGYWDASPIISKRNVNAIISKNMFRYIHPKYNRFLTMRECMALMGYDDRFNLINPAQSCNHICQSVPVNTAADSLRWASEIVLNTSDDIKIDSNILLQDNMKANLEENIFELKNLRWEKIK